MQNPDFFTTTKSSQTTYPIVFKSSIAKKSHQIQMCVSLSTKRNKKIEIVCKNLYLNRSGPLRKVFNPIFLSSEHSRTPEEKRKGTFICIIVLLSYFFVFWFFEQMHSSSLKCERLFYRISVRLKIGDYQFCYKDVLWHVKYCSLIMGLEASEWVLNDNVMSA